MRAHLLGAFTGIILAGFWFSSAYADGEAIYQARCASCHEPPARIALGAADLRGALPDWADFSSAVREGRAPIMPGFADDALSDEDMEAVYVYLGGTMPAPEPPPAGETAPPSDDPPSSAPGTSVFKLPGVGRTVTLPPANAGGRKLPPATPQHVKDYKSKCLGCHGPIETGAPYHWPQTMDEFNYPQSDIPNLRMLNKDMDFGGFRSIMQRGGKGMPAFPEFASPRAADSGFAIFKYIKDNPAPQRYRPACSVPQGVAPPSTWARVLWARSCARCHGADYLGATPPGRAGPIRSADKYIRANRQTARGVQFTKSLILEGHFYAPRFPYFSDSDAHSLFALISRDVWGVSEPPTQTPARDMFWRGEACHLDRCQRKKREIDEILQTARAAGDQRPMSGTKACARKIRKNRRSAQRVALCLAGNEMKTYNEDCGPYNPPVRVRVRPVN